ncbi:MAG: hypothetical protein DME26_13535, partial [Verrucomicrobia bacterium]
GLNPSKRYSFKGSAVRGNTAYTDRWTLFELVGADSFTRAHTANTLTSAKVASITASQVAINTGINSTGTTGDMAVWENISPGADGNFAVTCQQYTGPVPGGSSGGIKGYAMTGMRLEEFNVTQMPATITSQPTDQVVGESQPATFTVGASGNPSPSYQWYKNDVLIGGATNASYTIATIPLSDDSARFKVVVANALNSVTSGNALLHVLADTTAPALLNAQALGLTQVNVAFSERVAASGATNISNYAITSVNGGLTISSATLDVSGTNVFLTINPLTEGVLYTLTVNGIRDLSVAANRIAANSQTTFIAASYTPQDVGSPPLPGNVTPVPGGYDVTGSGTDIGGTADQFQFSYQQRTGDFDLKVRVVSLACFAAVFATPTLSGSLFESRATTAGSTTVSGSFPINYPSTWLRLRRVGDVFTGFAGIDGQTWVQLGATTLVLPSAIYVGMAVTSHNSGQSTTARLRDLSDVVTSMVGCVMLKQEPPGPSSRKTGLAITEIMYKPAPRADGRNLEFVELFNSNPFYEDISGYRLSGDIDFTFPPNTIIQGGAFIVVAKAPDDVKRVYVLSDVMGPYAGSLKSSGTVRLRNQIGAIYLEIPYSNKPPWPVAADGTGHSLVLARPSYGEGFPQAWDISDTVGGSPSAAMS